MKTSIWYNTKDKQPDTSGYYLGYRGWGVGGKADGDHDYNYFYYHKKTNEWYTYENQIRATFPDIAIVYYWTDANPYAWVNNDVFNQAFRQTHETQKNNPALEIAWKRVEEAIRQYEIIKSMVI
jgi:hypothetical protein